MERNFISFENDITSAILAAKGSGKTVMLATMLNRLPKGILFDMLGVLNPRSNFKTAIIPNSAYFTSVNAFISGHRKVPEKKYVINLSDYLGESLINATDTLCDYIMGSFPYYPVLVDEVADIIPQAGQISYSFHRMVKNGRNYGIRPIIFASQRPQNVNKNVLDLCDNFYVSMQRAPRSIEYILDIIDQKGSDEMASQIRQLDKREFIKFDGRNLTKFRVPTYKFAFKQ